MAPENDELDEEVQNSDAQAESHVEEDEVNLDDAEAAALDEVGPETVLLDERFTRERVTSDSFAAKSFNDHTVAETPDIVSVEDSDDDEPDEEDSDDPTDLDVDGSGASESEEKEDDNG